MIAEQTLDPELAEALAMLPIKVDGSISLEEKPSIYQCLI